MKKILSGLALALMLSGCVTTSSSSVDSDIQSYNYDGWMNITDTYQVTALRTKISDSEANTEELGLTLKYKDSDNQRNEVLISAEYIDSFRDLLIQKSNISEGAADNSSVLKLGQYKQIDVVTSFADGKRVISIGSLDGVFAFQEADVNEVLRLLSEIQKENG